MFKTFALIGFALVALTPAAAVAEMKPSSTPEALVVASAQTVATSATHRPTRSHRSEMRRRNNMSRERARAGAEHVRTMQ